MDSGFRYNMRSPMSAINRVSAKYFFPIVGLLVMAAGIFLACRIRSGSEIMMYAVFALACFLLALFLFHLNKIVYIFETRRFRLTTDGIEIHDLKHAHYSWKDIFDVAVMYFGATASRDSYYTVICCFLRQPEKEYKKRMLDWLYGAKNTDSIVIIEYSDAILNEFRTKYSGRISDYRADQLPRGK